MTVTFSKDLLQNIAGLPTFPMRLAMETFLRDGCAVLLHDEVFELAEFSTGGDVYKAEEAVSALKLGRIYFGNIIKCEYVEDVEDSEADEFIFWVNDDLIKGGPTDPELACDFDCINCECREEIESSEPTDQLCDDGNS